MNSHYPFVVIGAGPAGYVAALRLASYGLKTLCIDSRAVPGGTCLHVGCIPSKALLYSSEQYRFCQKLASTMGIAISEMELQFDQMMVRKEELVKGLSEGLSSLFQAKKQLDFVSGKASFVDSHTLSIQGPQELSQTISADYILLATGSEPIPLPFAPFDEEQFLSSTGALMLKAAPKRMVVVGAGVIGVELASVYRRLGSSVQLVEMMDEICPGLDSTLSASFLTSLKKQGLDFFLSSKVDAVQRQGAELLVDVSSSKELAKQTLACDVLLIAVGRRPSSRGLELERAGLQCDERGFIPVDSQFRTSQPHILAIGDLISGAGLAHRASEEAFAVADLLAGRKAHQVNYMAIPNVIYTHPEVAYVGLTEAEAHQSGLRPFCGIAHFRANPRARCSSEAEGLVKVVGDEQTGRLIGLHIMGAHASELIGQGSVALSHQATVASLAYTPQAHPTLSETIKEAALDALGKSLH